MPSVVHRVEAFKHIELKRGQYKLETIYRFVCGAQDGDGSFVRRDVTCPDCKTAVKQPASRSVTKGQSVI